MAANLLLLLLPWVLLGGAGDQVRYLARSFAAPGDHDGQRSHGFRFPYGPVTLIAPFNFPLEIPVLQLMGALYMGNRVTLKASEEWGAGWGAVALAWDAVDVTIK